MENAGEREERKKLGRETGEVGEQEDTRWLLHNEPAATRGNRNNYAKTERNGASRAKGKRRRRTLWDTGAYTKGASRGEMVVEMACKGGSA